ncbi:uracil-DNA glycosylase family protein [Marinicella sediminis]|uniref:Uracil-DNA glycosylase family protein n=1 Tax=Marinicella sediminis TaxID=1792834 RepID=A0ABV7JBI7_9GAMM
MKQLLSDISRCALCRHELPLGPRPVVQASTHSRILIIGQAPGSKVHATGVPWNDPSGDQLREWLGVDKACFYDPNWFAFMPMGFCYPGKGRSGDLPPMKRCAPTWHETLRSAMPDIQLTLLVGQYAQKHYLKDRLSLTERVKNRQDYLPEYMPLPHPSPRNRLWQRRNPWFSDHVVPQLLDQVQSILQA